MEPRIRDRIAEALTKYCEDRLRYAKKMVNPSLGTYRFGIGNYRARLSNNSQLSLRAKRGNLWSCFGAKPPGNDNQTLSRVTSDIEGEEIIILRVGQRREIYRKR